MIAWICNIVLLAADVVVLVVAWRVRCGRLPWILLLPGFVFGLQAVSVAAWAGAPFIPHWTVFSLMQSTAWALFLHLPIQLGAAALLSGRQAPAWFRLSSALGALGLVGVGVDAFLVEPHALEESHVPLDGPGVRVVLVADFQADRVGSYELGVIDRIRDLKPDLVLYDGDYIQTWEEDDFEREAAKLNAALATLKPRLGSVAVEGDVDIHDWGRIFRGLPVTVVHSSTTIDFGPVSVTALTPDDSRSTAPPVPRVSNWHVVLGHSPDFALALPPADLLLAGHTHGGQVRIPLFGPIFTLTKVPRDQASGLTLLSNGSHLYVSRGVGLERMDAPRLRFLCHPELVVIDAGVRSALVE
jgi:uncharacterized protein